MSRPYQRVGLPGYLSGVFLACLVIVSGAQAEQMQSHESIRHAAEQYAMEELDAANSDLSVEAGALDSRLRLVACPEPLTTFSPSGRRNGTRITVGVRCEASSRWTLYVPVTISRMMEIVVTQRRVARDSIILPADVTLERRDVAGLRRGYITAAEQVIGKKVTRTLRPHSVVTPDRLTIQHAVKRGSQVTILAKIGALEVRMKGKALDSGAIGERIKVENSDSSRQLEATVVSRDTVRVST